MAWVSTIMENNIRRMDRHFSAKKRQGPERTSEAQRMAKDIQKPVPTPSTEAARAEDLILVSVAMQSMSEDYQQVIRLCIFEGRSHREVSETLGRSEAATRMLLSRARAALSMEIDRLEGGGGE